MTNAQKFTSVEQYIAAQPKEKQLVLLQLRQAVVANLPAGFSECINCNMIGYVVPHQLFPAGYHCNPELPLPFMNLAAQKSHYGFYHMGIYAMAELESWHDYTLFFYCTDDTGDKGCGDHMSHWL